VPKKIFSEFRALLKAERERLLEEVRDKLAASGEDAGFVSQSKITDDDGLANAAAEVEVTLVMRESRELQEIDAALARIGDGSFGNCCDCGNDIDHARLKASPEARRCLPCQERYERAQSQLRTAGL